MDFLSLVILFFSYRDIKQNKGTILRASVDYIKLLRCQYDNINLVEDRCHLLSEENSSLQDRIRVGEILSDIFSSHPSIVL